MKWLWFFVCAYCFHLAVGAKILVLISTPGRSHAMLFDRLIVELAKKGHQVTVVSSFKQPQPVENLTEITLSTKLEDVRKINKTDAITLKEMHPLYALYHKTHMGLTLADLFLKNEKVQDLINSDEKFDLIIGEVFLNEAVLAGFKHKFQAPLIGFGPSMTMIWNDYLVGNPSYHSAFPNALLGYTTEMSTFQRVKNVVFGFISDTYHTLYHLRKEDQLMRKYFGDDLPKLHDIVLNTSLILLNYHHSYSYARPYPPNMIEVGGIHIGEPKPLPQDLKKYVDESKDGVIVFSMGSNIKTSALPSEKVQALLEGFSRLKQNVLLKYENETSLPNVPKNVKIMKWLPQSDLLGHPNVKLLIAHGGLGSTAEAVHRGVPLLGIPIHADQPMNMNFAETVGYGKILNFNDITPDTVEEAINEIINNPRYKEVAKERSELLKDAPTSALDRAVFWIEYVIRHKGAENLKSPVQNLSWTQYYGFDVLFFLFKIVMSFKWIRKLTNWLINKAKNAAEKKAENEGVKMRQPGKERKEDSEKPKEKEKTKDKDTKETKDTKGNKDKKEIKKKENGTPKKTNKKSAKKED